MQPRCWLWLWALIVLLPAQAEGGLYNTSEPSQGLVDPSYLNSFHRHLLDLRSLALPRVEFDPPMRRRYVLVSDLAKRGPTTQLTPDQAINLSDVLVRRGRADEAVELLRPFAAAQRDNLLLQANLATAYQMTGHYRGAIDTLDGVLESWPKDWNSLSPEQKKLCLRAGWEENIYRDFREAEDYHLRLLNLRGREPKLKEADKEKLDDLFRVRYVGDSGEFEVAGIAAAERKKLPWNAVEIVQRLVSWMPYDNRLYWQLGELMNVEAAKQDRPDIKQRRLQAAAEIFEELVYKREYRAEEALDHRRKIRQALLASDQTPEGEALTDLQKPPEDAIPVDPIAWRPLVIAFVAGMLVMLFAQWQWRELRRRRGGAVG